ncbi:helix-turn-helix domain-containing protein [Kibdelosporangium philippinense]|uniref:Helix-turn-helix domain-containing protein n=1 Tax=Kibdelosporangium philippinense TaxID=211113 RepID=A0ABS8ZT72_9PSEU|nr:helix-turn-helix transcriptional regulator [Kibdelosporangium philippinense]MCE7010438.1 helix-turn-helix domain-containing protein [Kibdelosporangium philippinense]
MYAVPDRPTVDSTLGERVGVRRRQQGLSRRAVANLVGRSEEWLRQVERGQRKLDSIEVLTHLARVLHIDDLTEFLGWRDDETARNEPNCGPLTERLRDVLMQPLFMAEPVRTPPVPRLCMELDHLLATWCESARRYTVVANLLPCLLKRLRGVSKSGEQSPELAAALTQAYGLACAFAARMNDHHLAWIAADLCMDVAVESGDPVLIGAAAVHRTACMRAMGYLPQAREFAQESANRLQTDREEVIKGALLLQAAEAAAADNEPDEAFALHAQARAIADQREKDDIVASIYFGPTEVGIREVGLLVRLGRLDKALRLARTVSMPTEAPHGTQIRHLVTMAFAYTRTRDDVAAVFALNRVAAIAPADLRFDPLARQAIRGLTKRGHVLVAEDLAKLSSEACLA